MHEQTIAIAATFTAEPIEDSLAFWIDQLDLPMRLQFAPYNQVFQQVLDPDSLFARNQHGVNVMLVRLDDWLGHARPAAKPAAPDASLKTRVLAGHSSHALPNGMEIAHLNAYETDYLYSEIFREQTYMAPGIELGERPCVFDVGANIGMFTLWMKKQHPDARMYAFEPAPAAYEALQVNAALYAPDAKVFGFGLSSVDGVAPFTFYERSSVFSGYHADAREDADAIKGAIRNTLASRHRDERATAPLAGHVDELIEDRLSSRVFEIETRTLSRVLRDEGIEYIDLLKIDAERSEWGILEGIDDHDWPKIRQIVMEVHDQAGTLLPRIEALLRGRGYHVSVTQHDVLRESGLYTLYALPAASTTDLRGRRRSEISSLHENARDFAVALQSASARWAVPSIVCVCPSSPGVNADPQLRSALDDAEVQLAADLSATAGVQVLQPRDVAALYAVPHYDDAHAESIGHIPYAAEWFAAAGTMLARRIAALNRPPLKVISLDCDDTLWGGICGEVGARAVEIDAARAALQQFVLEQHRAGMIVCLCSRNNEEDVFAVFEQRPDMLLHREHLAAWRINWRSKSENLKALAAELQLGLDSFVHLDDDPVACADVRANCPEVLTLQLPKPPAEIPRFLEHVWAFDRVTFTEEDQRRTALYQEQRARDQARQQSSSFADFITGLELDVHIAPLTEQDVSRAAQLTLRTNQFNCTTIRRSEQKLQTVIGSGTLEGLRVRLSDRFGDYGLVGLLLFRNSEDVLDVDTFLLSCRALGRGVEHRMLAALGAIAQARGRAIVQVRFVPSAKNQPALEFLESVGAPFRQSREGGSVFRFPADHAAAVRFTPGAEPPSPSRHTVPSDAVVSPQAAEARAASTRSALVQRVATELQTVEQIVQAIRSSHQRPRPELPTPVVPPRTPVEETLAEIWTTLLNVNGVGVEDDFVQLGGHSLLATVLLSRVRDAFAVEIALHEFFAQPTIAGLAAAIEQAHLDRADEGELAEALEGVSQLSDEEVRALLTGERG